MIAILLILTAPGTPITVEAKMTYTVTASTTVVVRSPLPIGPVYPTNAVQRWRHPATGEVHTWIDPCLAGVTVRWQREDGVWTDGVVDRDRYVWRSGVRQIRLDEQPQMKPRQRVEKMPWELR